MDNCENNPRHPIPCGVSFFAATVAAFFVCGGLGGSAEFGFQRTASGREGCGPRQGMTACV